MRYLMILVLVLALALPCWGETVTTYPRFSSDAHTIYYGVDRGSVGSSIAPYYDTSAAAYTVMTIEPLRLSAGTYRVTGASWLASFNNSIANAWIVVYSVDGGVYTREWYYEITSYMSLAAGAIAHSITAANMASSDDLVLAGDTNYLIGLCFKKTSSPAGQAPYIYRMDVGDGPLETVQWSGNQLGTGLTLPPASASGGTAPTVTNAVPTSWKFTLTTTNYKIYETATSYFSGTDVDLKLPQCANDYWIFLRGVVVSDGETLTVALNNQSSGAETATATLVIDMGATDKVSFGGSDVNLGQRWTGTCTGGVYEADEAGKTTLTMSSALDRGWWAGGAGNRARYLQIAGINTFLVSTYVDTTHIRVTGDASTASDSAYYLSEEGDTFDVGINVRPVANKVDVFWVNKTTGQGSLSTAGTTWVLRDIITRGHACSAGTPARHAAAYACTLDPAYLTISGADTEIDQIQVGYRPMVLLGDSQMISFPTVTGAPAPALLGAALLTATTGDRYGWMLGVNGGLLSADATGIEALWKKFDNDTSGKGDGCEMSGVVLVIEGGINDLSAILSATPTDEEANKAVAACVGAVGRIVTELYERANAGGAGDGRHAIICGLPRYPGAASPSAQQVACDAAAKYVNYTYEGIAAGCRATFYNPYPLGTSIINTTDYIHYTEAGAGIVAGRVAGVYERGVWQRKGGGTNRLEW